MTQGLAHAHAPAGGLTQEAAGGFLGELFDEHGARVYGLCRLLLRDAVEAEDAAQQTFLSAYRSLLNGHTPRDPAVWLSTIARNECRARIRARVTELLAPVDEDEQAGGDLEDVAAARVEIEALYQALTELSQPQREAIVLRELHGLSYDEVSAASGMPVSAVKSVLFRARRRLQSKLRLLGFVPGVLPLPLALRDSLAQAIPGFASASAASGSAVKLASLPLAAKLAGATMSVAVVGAIGGSAVEQRDLHGPPQVAKGKAIPTAPAGRVTEPRGAESEPRLPGAVPAAASPESKGGEENEVAAEAEETESAEAEANEPADAEPAEPTEIESGGGSGEPAEPEGDESPSNGESASG